MCAMLNVHHIELFYYVARHGGITPALAHIPYGIQQPAVSLQLGRLEESLGLKLFERRPFALTPAGTALYEHSAPFFAGLPTLENKLFGDTREHLRLAASPQVLREHLPDLLGELGAKPPALRLTLREADQPTAEALLRSQHVDIAIVVIESAPAGFQSEPLLELQPVLVVRADDPAATDAAVLARAKTGPLPLIALAAHIQPSTAILAQLDARGIAWEIRVEASSTQLVETYVAAGHGTGISVAVPGSPPPPTVRHLPLRGFRPIVFGALWSGRQPEIAARFLDRARERARSLAPVPAKRRRK
jgi:DNA-binding transcriptional LysR family regulator